MEGHGDILTRESTERLARMLDWFDEVVDLEERNPVWEDIPRGRDSSTVWCKVLSHTSGQKWLCDVYGNGRYDDDGNTVSSTESDQDLYLPDHNNADTTIIDEFCLAVNVGTHYEGKFATWTA